MRPASLLGRPWALPKVARDAAWITAGSLTGAIGTMVGFRLVTEFAQADVFGAFVIVNGIVALSAGVALQPVAQAALRFYPELEARGAVEPLRDIMAFECLRRLAWLAPLLVCSVVVEQIFLARLSAIAWIAAVTTLCVEPLKTVEVVLRNASGDQAGYSLLGATDAAARLLGAAACAFLLGSSLETLLVGQLIGTVVVLLIFVRRLPRKGVAKDERFRRDLRAYGAPLAGLPVFGWLISQGDRYVVATLLGPAAAGAYAAAYGLVSRPMLMLGGIADATLRQRLYTAVARADARASKHVQTVWLALNCGVGVAAALLIAAFGHWIVALVLAEPFRAPALPLLFPIALGHIAILAYQAVIRRLYAAGRTRQVLISDGVAGVFAVFGALVGALTGGVSGVAWAMPVYTLLQLALALAFARKL